jgi:hypothetical protein
MHPEYNNFFKKEKMTHGGRSHLPEATKMWVSCPLPRVFIMGKKRLN